MDEFLVPLDWLAGVSRYKVRVFFLFYVLLVGAHSFSSLLFRFQSSKRCYIACLNCSVYLSQKFSFEINASIERRK